MILHNDNKLPKFGNTNNEHELLESCWINGGCGWNPMNILKKHVVTF